MKENDIYLEEIQERFEEIISEKRWDLVQPIYREMEEKGFGSKVPALSQIMTDEDVREYNTWDIKTNGSIETQMDDDSGDSLQATDIVFNPKNL